MKKATNKLMSFLAAFAMVLSVLVAPFTSANAAGESTAKDAKTNTVTLHKMLIDKTNLDKFPKKDEEAGLDNTIYDGNALANAYFGTNAKDIGGVYFAWAKQDADGEYYWANENGNIIGEKTKDTDTRVKAEKGKYKNMPANTYGGLTEDNKGFEFQTTNFSGTYKIFEIESKSTYLGGEDKDSTLTGSKAVPVEITLPLVNNKGTIPAAHVYPKNTEDKPTTNKDFSDKFDQTNPNGRDYEIDETDVQDNVDNSAKEKKDAWEPKNVGDTVKYKVVSTIPANSRYATAYWNDEMTDGLTLDIKTVELAYTGNNVTLTKGTDYTVKPTSNKGNQGFELEFTPDGLEKINNKENKGTITITYSAKVNENAVVAIPESNDVNFFYGNNPRKGNTPKPNYPGDNGELKVTKTWDDGVWAEGEDATFRLVDAQTGKTVTADDLVQGDATDADFEAYKKEFKAEKTIGFNKEEGGSTGWKYLDKNKQYKAVEINMTAGTEASYKVNDKGEIVVVNHETNNPAPINPTEPKVVTYGARFVKTNADGSERLPGAEFVVRNSEGKFLTGTAANRTAYQAAQDAYVAKIKEYNGKQAEEQTNELRAEIKKLEEARDKAWNATLQDMTQWGEKANAIKLTSNDLGQFEIAGLAPGKYTLVETKAPKGFVDAEKAKLEFEFEITQAKEGLVTKDIDFGVKDDNAEDNAKQIINKKVTIPQTGGIGSLIFIVAGLALMGVAFVAMKRRNSYEEA